MLPDVYSTYGIQGRNFWQLLRNWRRNIFSWLSRCRPKTEAEETTTTSYYHMHFDPDFDRLKTFFLLPLNVTIVTCPENRILPSKNRQLFCVLSISSPAFRCLHSKRTQLQRQRPVMSDFTMTTTMAVIYVVLPLHLLQRKINLQAINSYLFIGPSYLL